MDRLRQIAPLLALLLSVVVAGEVTDLLPCGDSACGVWNVLINPDAPAPDGGDHDPAAACLCQAHFVSTVVPLSAPTPVLDDDALWSAYPSSTSSLTGRVPHPPPKG